MIRKGLFQTFSVLVFCAIYSIAANASGAKDPASAKEKQKTITGTIRSVSSADNSFVLVSKGKEHEFQLAPQGLVVINNKLARLGEIKKNASAEVVYVVDQKTRIETAKRVFATQTVDHAKGEIAPGCW